MPARSITRPGIPGRIRNPYYAQAQTAPGVSAVAGQQANAQRLAQLREQQAQIAASGQTGLGLHFSLDGAPEANVQTPHGVVGLFLAPQGPTINHNLTFTAPYDYTSSGYTSSGTTTYHYGLQENKGIYELVPQQTAQQGSVSYGGTVVATTKNNIMTPTQNTISNPIYSHGTFLGTMTYALAVSNKEVSLVPKSFVGTSLSQSVYGNVSGIGSHVLLGTLTEKTLFNPAANQVTEQYQGFAGRILQRTVPVWFTDPYSGTSYKVGYSWESKKTTFNPSTNQVNIPFPTLMQTFGYFSTPLYRQAQTTTVALGGTTTEVKYNMSVNPFSTSTFYTGFGSTNAQTTTVTSTSGTTRSYSINNGNIVNTSAAIPIKIAGLTTRAVQITNFVTGTVSIANPAATYLSGGVLAVGSLSLSGTAIRFTPSLYSFVNGANTEVVPNTSTTVLDALGGPALTMPPGGTLTEKINKATGVLSYSYAYPASRPSTLSPTSLSQSLSQASHQTIGSRPSLLHPTDSTISTLSPQSIQSAWASPSSKSNTYSKSKNLSTVSTISSAPSASPYAWSWNPIETPIENIHGYLSDRIVKPLTSAQYQGSPLAFWQPVATTALDFGSWESSSVGTTVAKAIPSTMGTPFQNNTAVNWARSFAVAGISSILNIPASASSMLAEPVGSIYGTASFVGQVATHPVELANPSVAGQVVGSAISFAILGKIGGSITAASEEVPIEIKPSSLVTAYTSNPTGYSSELGFADEATALDRLNMLKAQPTYYLKGLQTGQGIISATDYQVGFGNGKFFYAINPSATDFSEAYSNAAQAIDRTMYTPPPAGTPMLAGSRYIFSTEEGQGFILQGIGKMQADISIPSGVQKLWGTPVKNIMGMTIEYTSSSAAASTETATETAVGEASYTVKLLVKRNPISSFFSGESYKAVPVSTGTAAVPAAYVTGTDEGFVGRILPQDNGYMIRTADSSSSFFGSNPQQTVLGREFTGFTLTEGRVTPIAYYEASDLGGAAKALGIDIATPDGSTSTAAVRLWKPMSMMPEVVPEPATTFPLQTLMPEAASEASTLPITKMATSFKAAVISTPSITSLAGSVEMEGEFSAAFSTPALISSIGYDPMAVLTTNTRQASISSRQQLNSADLLSHSIGIATTLFQNQRTTTTQKIVQSNVMGIMQSSFLKTSTIQRNIATQRSTQKTTQRSATSSPYPSVGFPHGFPQPNVPLPVPLAPTKIPPKHHHIHSPPSKRIVFGYQPDISSILLGIHGKKKNKKFYQSVGLSRPIL